MRSLLIVLFLIMLITPALAQERTLLGDAYQSSSFGGPVVKFTSIDDDLGVLVGGYGGVVYNKKIAVGGGGFGLVNRSEEYGMGYGGLIVEYIHNSDNLSHFSCGFLIGLGGVEDKRSYFDDSIVKDDDDESGSKSVFVFEPEIKYELNATNKLRVGIGVGYRLMSGSKISNEIYSQVSGSITFKFVKKDKD